MKTVIVIHGWNNLNYTRFGCKDAWENRKQFISELSRYFNVIKLNLPGFCGEEEPDRIWSLKDFAIFFNEFLTKNRIQPDIVLGYSFGAAVAVSWKILFYTNSKLALVSPAISRAYKKQPSYTKLFSLKKIIPRPIVNFLRGAYLKKVGNKFYTDGTKFLKGTYLNIVRVDLASDVKKIVPAEILIIFGSNDTATPPKILIERLNNSAYTNRIKIIENGTHDIANSHSEEISKMIYQFSENGN